MSRQVQIKNGTSLVIEDKCFASGGEGDLHRILSPAQYRDFVVKLFKPDKQTPERERKIDFLSGNAPFVNLEGSHKPVIWVEKPIYQSGRFAGFIMPLAKGEKLELLCNLKLPPKLGSEWRKFDFSSPGAIELRQKICFNIAVAIHSIHSLSNYVLVDMKPENIMIQSNGLISIIDTDSVQIRRNGHLVHHAPVVTPEYTPPEYYRGVKPETTGTNESWDRFSLAVIFYRLLCGIHPFVGSCHPPYDQCNGFDAKIENGLFPKGRNTSKFKVVPPDHTKFDRLSKEVRQLFLRCFDEGHGSPDLRPTLEEWCKAFVPDFVANLSRPLVSAVYKFPAYNKISGYNSIVKSITSFPFLSHPKIPKPSFLRSIFNRFGKLSPKEKHRKLLSEKNDRFLELCGQKHHYEERLEQLIASYNDSQQRLLGSESNELENLKEKFSSDLLRIDKKVKDLVAMERDEYRKAQLTIRQKTERLRADIAKLQDSLLGNENRRFENRKISFNALLAHIERQKASEINTAISNPKKLVGYSIAINVKQIFSGGTLPQVISNLQQNHIFSAADFTDVDSSGQVKKTNGNWVKIAGLGSARAGMLGTWRRDIEQKEDQAIRYAVATNHQGAINQANNDFSSFVKNWNDQIKPLKAKFETEKKFFEQQIRTCEKEFKIEEEKIKVQFDNQYIELDAEAQRISSEIVSSLSFVKDLFESKLKENFDTYTNSIAEVKNETNSFISYLVNSHQELLALLKEFQSL